MAVGCTATGQAKWCEGWLALQRPVANHWTNQVPSRLATRPRHSGGFLSVLLPFHNRFHFGTQLSAGF